MTFIIICFENNPYTLIRSLKKKLNNKKNWKKESVSMLLKEENKMKINCHEKELEEKAFQGLIALGYEEVRIQNQEDLIKNFQKQFLKYNLKNRIDNFTDINQLNENWFNELEYTLFNANKIKNVLDTFELLRDRHNVQMRDSKKFFLLELLNKKDWCKNLFQVARQVVMEDAKNNQTYRYDLVLFINGLPLVLIELKKRGQNLEKAFKQIKNYSSNFQSLFRYIEILIISEGNETEYFANQDNLNLLDRHRFRWTDFDYKPLNNFIMFIDDFLKPCRLAQTIARYIFLHETKKSLLIMRPHQIHATEKLLKLSETNNNGYIWHTTGSGKTFTSFALCHILQTTTKAQIFFLTDRKELDFQTFQEFYSFNEKSVKKIETTSALIEYFQNDSNQIVATLIHKMNKLIKMPQNTKLLEKWRQREIFFMIDECHRTQSGSMHDTLKHTFPQARFFGFTGTPFFKDHIPTNEKSTEELFGDCKHTYTMYRALKEAPRCKCVLPFCIRYSPKKDLESKVQYILKHHYEISRQRTYNAILIAPDIKHLLKYYELFQKELQQEPTFKIAAIFSNNIDSKENSKQEQSISEQQLDKIIKEYDPSADRKNYHQIILRDMKKGGGTIDLLIVVRMFLTGFDSPLLNALYVDRPLKKHELFQAFSRTIRKDNNQKPYGNIYCFQTTKEEVDNSLNIFVFDDKDKKNNKDDPMHVILEDYDKDKEEYEQKSQALLQFAPTPQMVDEKIIGSKKNEIEYLKKFNDVKQQRNKLKTYQPEFNKDILKNSFSISEDDFLNYQSKYEKIREGKNQKISSSSSLTFEEKKQKLQEFIEEVRQITPTPEDVLDLDDIKKVIFQRNFNILDHYLKTMRSEPRFNINEFSLTEEELKLYQQKRDQLEEEEEREYIVDLDYLEQLLYKLNELSKKSSKPSQTFSEIEEERKEKINKMVEEILLSNLPLNEKKLLEDYVRSDYFADYYQSKSLKQESNLNQSYNNFIEQTQESELKTKAYELCLPLGDLKQMIEFKKMGTNENFIKLFIYDVLEKNSQAIDAYRKNNPRFNRILGYKLEIKLQKYIYDFIQNFIKKYLLKED